MFQVLKNRIKNRLRSMLGITELYSKIDTVEGKVSLVEGKINLIESKASLVEGKVSLIENKVSLIEGKVSLIESKASLIENKVNAQLSNQVEIFSNSNKIVLDIPGGTQNYLKLYRMGGGGGMF